MQHPYELRLVGQTFSYPSLGNTVHIKIPRVERRSHTLHNTTDCPDVKILHAQFRWEAARGRLCEDDSGLTAEDEVEVIQKAFPAVVQADLQCAMAAWLFILCFVDDLIDTMSPDDGVAAAHQLALSMVSMPGGSSSGGRKQDTLGVHFSDVSTAADTNVFERLERAVSCFRDHAKVWVPDAAHNRFCMDVGEVFMAMATDVLFKSRKDRDTLEYLNIRTISIGTGPFCCLLRFSMGYNQYPTPQLVLLEACVGSLTALQNDIIGLERDIETGEWMNYAVIYSGYSGSIGGRSTYGLDLGIRQTIEEYHLALELAHDYWNSILDGECEEEINVAASLLDFVGQHFDMASRCKRYRP